MYSITTNEPLKFLDFISAFASVVLSFWSYVVVFESFVTVILLTYFCKSKLNVLFEVNPKSILEIFLFNEIVSVVAAVILFPFIVTSLDTASEFSVSFAAFIFE